MIPLEPVRKSVWAGAFPSGGHCWRARLVVAAGHPIPGGWIQTIPGVCCLSDGNLQEGLQLAWELYGNYMETTRNMEI